MIPDDLKTEFQYSIADYQGQSVMMTDLSGVKNLLKLHCSMSPSTSLIDEQTGNPVDPEIFTFSNDMITVKASKDS